MDFGEASTDTGICYRIDGKIVFIVRGRTLSTHVPFDHAEVVVSVFAGHLSADARVRSGEVPAMRRVVDRMVAAGVIGPAEPDVNPLVARRVRHA